MSGCLHPVECLSASYVSGALDARSAKTASPFCLSFFSMQREDGRRQGPRQLECGYGAGQLPLGEFLAKKR